MFKPVSRRNVQIGCPRTVLTSFLIISYFCPTFSRMLSRRFPDIFPNKLMKRVQNLRKSFRCGQNLSGRGQGIQKTFQIIQNINKKLKKRNVKENQKIWFFQFFRLGPPYFSAWGRPIFPLGAYRRGVREKSVKCSRGSDDTPHGVFDKNLAWLAPDPAPSQRL